MWSTLVKRGGLFGTREDEHRAAVRLSLPHRELSAEQKFTRAIGVSKFPPSLLLRRLPGFRRRGGIRWELAYANGHE